MIKFTLPLPPSLNQVIRLHWAVRNRLLDDIKSQTYLEIRSHFGQRIPMWDKIKVKYTIYSSHIWDADNRVSIRKLINDSIKEAGLIKDDSPEYLEDSDPAFVVDKDRREVEVEIRRIDNGT